MTTRILATAQLVVSVALALPAPGVARAQVAVADSVALAAVIGEWIQAPHRNRTEACVVIDRPEVPATATWARLIAAAIARADSTAISRAPTSITPRVRISAFRATADTVFVDVFHIRCRATSTLVTSTGLSAKFVRDSSAWVRVQPLRGEASAGAGHTCPW